MKVINFFRKTICPCFCCPFFFLLCLVHTEIIYSKAKKPHIIWFNSSFMVYEMKVDNIKVYYDIDHNCLTWKFRMYACFRILSWIDGNTSLSQNKLWNMDLKSSRVLVTWETCWYLPLYYIPNENFTICFDGPQQCLRWSPSIFEDVLNFF